MERVGPAGGRPAKRPSGPVRALLAMLLTALLLGGAVPYVSGSGRSYLSYLVLAEGQDAQGATRVAGLASAAGGQVVQEYPQIGAVLVYAADGFGERLRGRPGVAAVGATRTEAVPSPPGALAGIGDFRRGSDALRAAGAGRPAGRRPGGAQDCATGALETCPLSARPARVPGGCDPHPRAGCGSAAAPSVRSAAASGGLRPPSAETSSGWDEAEATTPDPREAADWNLAMIGAVEAPERTAALLRRPAADHGSNRPLPSVQQLRRVLVAVLDSGVDDTHPDLRSAVDPTASASCADGRPDPRSGAWRPDEGVTESGHGTHVAGIVGAARDGKGVTGVAPGVRIAAVRLLGPLGQYYAENIVCGVLWAADHGAKAINDSYFADPWKYNCPEDPDQAALITAVGRAVGYAQRQGAVVVASAGNDGQDLAAARTDQRSPNDRTSGPAQDRHLGTECIRLPGELPGVVAVGAVDRSGMPTAYSNYGRDRIALTAPGGDPDGGALRAIVSDWPGGQYAALAGTSMAAAHVTGAVAVVAAEHPDWSPDRTVALLAQAAAANCPIGQGRCTERDFYGAGVLALPRE
ncbi:S8 family serine peptidase [Saccharothrix sp. ST-888]|uniref:S8 family serine peptidase n=1 Tax=Saccharothrix sp. ST-888 TaxID=1427391 RepID=UPI0005ED2762|nr:S8 family serine peptidase [Saccharothrix sp. ST-888]KJK58267.1 peptidase S08 family protein [Saccharothrix sp. ST-888]